jgi:trehalose 6-phosphate synthase/phosphatase
MKKRIIIVSNRLPVSVTQTTNNLTLQRSNGGLATALSSLMEGQDYDSLWVGWSGADRHIPQRKLLKAGWDKRLIPVALQGDVLHRYYERMSNGVLWPQLHGLPAAITHEAADWRAYVTANQKFATKLRALLRPDDVVWVHDYHLMLLPQLLRDMGATNCIGFFLHSPFAKPDCLKALPEYGVILQSLAQVDVLGFQTTRDADNFRSSVAQTQISLRPGCSIRAFPIGVDYESYRAAAYKPAVRQAKDDITARLEGRQAILSVSRLDYTKGIPEQLLAYEQFLASVPSPSDYLYKLIVAPSREDVAGYSELKQRIDHEVARINARFSRAIEYTYYNCGFDELAAWYQIADTLLVTPIIDGMNLVVKEYIAARHDNRGTIVLSETIGAAQQLRTALQVNPRDVATITAAIQRAVHMPSTERSNRWELLRDNVQYEDVFWWLNDFLAALQSKSQMVLASQQVHTPRMRFSQGLASLQRLRSRA